MPICFDIIDGYVFLDPVGFLTNQLVSKKLNRNEFSERSFVIIFLTSQQDMLTERTNCYIHNLRSSFFDCPKIKSN
jgi:hypothetical protein